MVGDALHSILVLVLVAPLMAYLVAERLTMATTISMHRGHSHDSVGYRRLVQFWLDYSVARVGIWINAYAVTHIRHHQETDTEKDPHAPCMNEDPAIDDDRARQLSGVYQVLRHNVSFYDDYAKDEAWVRSQKRPPRITWIDEWAQQHRALNRVFLVLTHAFGYVMVGLLVDALTPLSVWLPAYALLALPVGGWSLRYGGDIYIRRSAEINAFGHAWHEHHRRKPIGRGSNHRKAARRAWGEGLQFWHHSRQRSPRFRDPTYTSWRDDKGWVAIRLLQALRLTTFVREVADHSSEPNPRILESQWDKQFWSIIAETKGTKPWRLRLRQHLRAQAKSPPERRSELVKT
ncbi:MAG: hypothetical protein AAGA95_18580 [Pseudomonadota bacterium]